MIEKMGVCPGRLESPKVSVHLEPQSVALLGNLVLQTQVVKVGSHWVRVDPDPNLTSALIL